MTGGSVVVTGIGQLVTCAGPDAALPVADRAVPAQERLGVRHDAALVVEDGRVVWVGDGAGAPAADRSLDVGGRAVVPGFVDSHSHLVFAGDRSAEFSARMAGTPYDGGGIGVTVAATREATDDELRRLLAARVAEARALGTTTLERALLARDVADDEARALTAEVADEIAAEAFKPAKPLDNTDHFPAWRVV